MCLIFNLFQIDITGLLLSAQYGRRRRPGRGETEELGEEEESARLVAAVVCFRDGTIIPVRCSHETTDRGAVWRVIARRPIIIASYDLPTRILRELMRLSYDNVPLPSLSYSLISRRHEYRYSRSPSDISFSPYLFVRSVSTTPSALFRPLRLLSYR